MQKPSLIIAASCGMLFLALSSTAAAGQKDLADPASSSPGVLLGSSESIESRYEAQKRREVLLQLANLPYGPEERVLSAHELDVLLGDNGETAGSTSGLQSVNIEARVGPRLPAQSSQAEIRFGLAAIVYAGRHPDEAWRLFLPVLR